MRNEKSIINIPDKDCPFIESYNEEPDDLFCLGCGYLKRDSEYDEGENKNNWKKAYICEKDCMTPDILYQDHEPNMKWE